MPVYIVIILIYFVPHFWEPLLYIQLNSCAMFIHFNPWLVVWNIFYSIQLGMSSSQLLLHVSEG